MRRVPERGDIWHVGLDPAAGREQHGARPVFVLSPSSFNRLGLALICPVLQGAIGTRYAGFAASLTGAGTDSQGVVLCNQARVLDFDARSARFIERMPEAVTQDVLARVAALLE